jgi:hypothetical protein
MAAVAESALADRELVFMSMDKMVGGDFEKGLAQVKTVAEAASKT